jgi:hypothetical protein
MVTNRRQSNDINGFKFSMEGIVAQNVIRPEDSKASYAVFMIPNLESPSGDTVFTPPNRRRAARLNLAAGGWKITLDRVENYDSVVDSLRVNSGFAVTQIGRLERDNDKAFTAKDAEEILNALAWYVSFASGRWTSPILTQGYDQEDKPIWQLWDIPRIVSYRARASWMDLLCSQHFADPFPGFLKLWLDDAWEETVRVAIHWYVEANAQAGSIEGSIVLTQTAFELLSHAVLVEHNSWLSGEGYDKLSASDRFRLLFRWASIPSTIPAELKSLTKDAKADNWHDTSTAMTMIRNSITHPTQKNRKKLGKHSIETRYEVWTLGLWNLELCLLRLFDYRGSYRSRITKQWTGEVELVPWIANQQATSI